jgi:hypothetical protein
MDASDEIVRWARDAGFSFIDLNVFPNPAAGSGSKDMVSLVSTFKQWLIILQKDITGHQRRVITYVWDNYVE